MFVAVILVCSMYANPKCVEVYDTIKPYGYEKLEDCQNRIFEMAIGIRSTIPVPHSMEMKCLKKENKNERRT